MCIETFIAKPRQHNYVYTTTNKTPWAHIYTCSKANRNDTASDISNLLVIQYYFAIVCLTYID